MTKLTEGVEEYLTWTEDDLDEEIFETKENMIERYLYNDFEDQKALVRKYEDLIKARYD